MIPVGHDRVREELQRELPRVTLLLGPPSVGKWALAQHLAVHHKVLKVDLREIEYLTAEHARDLKAFASVAPFGKMKLVLINLERASEVALNALLKLLEEPPPIIRFVLVASGKVLPTIVSRAAIYRCGVLSDSEVTTVLRDRFGMAPDKARTAAAWGRGRVDQALGADLSQSARAACLTILRAVAARDRELFASVVRTMEPEVANQARQLLLAWCREAVTGRWRLFSETESHGLASGDREVPRKILLALGRLSHARAKLALRAGLESFLSQG